MHDSARLSVARQAYERHAWSDAIDQLAGADQERPLGVDDLERLAVAYYLTGQDAPSAAIWMRAHQECVDQDDPARAARCAFWLGWQLLFQGDYAQASGWFGRARRLLDDGQLECAVRGFLLIPEAFQVCDADPAAAYDAYSTALEIGRRFNDRDLIAIGQLGQGESLIRLQRVPDGVALLDEAMVAVTAGEVSPVLVGVLYCATITACQEIFDFRRAREWTTVLTRWCDSQPDLVPYRGVCLIHRSQILQMHGDWQSAFLEARRARERLSEPNEQPALGAAWYQQAELHRLRGEFDLADEGYRIANQWGFAPVPGIAQLRLARGDVEAALATIRRGIQDAPNGAARSRLLAAHVEIAVAAGDVAEARAASDDLVATASALNTPWLGGLSGYALGSVLLAEGSFDAALETLRQTWSTWQMLEAPYEAARCRDLIGVAYQQLGDEVAAEMEFDAAGRVFRDLGAVPDLNRVKARSRTSEPTLVGGLSAREIEVLRQLATGRSNRAIAESLFLSEKTVARHLTHIFTKMGVENRAGAAAFALRHGLA